MRDFFEKYSDGEDEYVERLEDAAEAREPVEPEPIRAVEMTFELLREALS